MSFWSPNIESKGRKARIFSGLVAIAAGGGLIAISQPIAAAALLISGAFMIFEGARGWCLLRACKIRTPM